VVFSTNDLSTEVEINEWRQQGNVVGVAHRGVLDNNARWRLQSQMPDVEFDNVWEIEKGYYPPKWLLWLMITASAIGWLLFVVSATWFFRSLRCKAPAA
jgi:hypothetical protein